MSVAGGLRRRPSALTGLLLALAGALSTWPTHAQNTGPDTPLHFESAAERRRFQALASELRCVMCQNQSLADSNAQIARDLRHEVLDLMRQGKSDRQIKDFLVSRYGQFVLYRPDFDRATWLLWLGPAIIALLGTLTLARVVRRRARQPIPPDDEQEW